MNSSGPVRQLLEGRCAQAGSEDDLTAMVEKYAIEGQAYDGRMEAACGQSEYDGCHSRMAQVPLTSIQHRSRESENIYSRRLKATFRKRTLPTDV